ncbi:hypothetical protein [Endozoicomonas sp. 2B-B]
MPHPSAISEHPLEWSSVQACPASTPDLPQGNLDHELKEFLKRFAECMSNGQPLPVSDYKPFIKYFGKLPPNADPDQLDSEDYLLKIKEDPCYIEQVPQEKLTPDLCVQACTRLNYGNLQYVPERIKTDEFYRALALEECNALNWRT